MNLESTEAKEITCDIELQKPFERSRNTVHRLATIKTMRIIQSFRHASVIRVGMPLELFHKWYGVEPERGMYPPPAGAETFIVSIKVRKP